MASSRLKTLVSYSRPYRQRVLFGTIALLIVNLLAVYLPRLVRSNVDKLQGNFTFEEIYPNILLLAILASLTWLIRVISRVLIFGIGRQVEFDLKQKIFEHLLILEPSYFATNTSGDLINRATSDVDNIRRLLGFALLSIINTTFAYSLTLPAMLSINIPLSLGAISVYPMMLILVGLFSNKLQIQQREVQEKLSELSELVQEDVSGMSLIKIYAQEENEHRAFAEKNKQLLAANVQLAKTRNQLFPIIQAISSVSLLILLWLGAGSLERGEITIGDFVSLIIYVELLVFPTALLGFTITAYQRGEVSIDRIEAILTVKPKIKNLPDAIALPPEKITGKITAQNLSYTYPGSDTPAVNNLSFTISAGEVIAIVGSIGAGKTTLANAIPRLLDISEGQLFLDGYDITKLKLEDLRSAIAYVPQDSFLFSTTLQNNIRYGDPLQEQPDIERAAKISQIHREILNFPRQYDTIVGERGITLSGGQRQRTSLARALLVDASVLILDDALSSVDNQTATDILNNLACQKGKTVIFISHQLSAAATADRIFVMEAGQIVQIGSHEELVVQKGSYQSLWNQHKLGEILG